MCQINIYLFWQEFRVDAHDYGREYDDHGDDRGCGRVHVMSGRVHVKSDRDGYGLLELSALVLALILVEVLIDLLFIIIFCIKIYQFSKIL